MTEQQKPEIKSQPSVMTARIQVTRAKTGKVEEYDLVFTPVPEEPTEDKEAE